VLVILVSDSALYPICTVSVAACNLSRHKIVVMMMMMMMMMMMLSHTVARH
jgi:hypothetical protein